MTATRRGLERGDGRRLLSLTWAHLLNDGASNYLPGVLPAILMTLGQPVRMAGALMAALVIGQALQPITGWLADRTGGNTLTALGLLLSSLGGAVIGFVPQTWLLIVVLLIIGIGGALFHPQALAGVRSMVRGRQGLITSSFLVGGELGRGLWPTVAGVVVSGLGLGWLWLVGLPGLLTVPLLKVMAPRLPARPRGGGRLQWHGRGGPLSVLIIYRSVQAFATYVLVTYLPILWHLRGGSLVNGALIITVMVSIGVVGNLGGGHLADRFGRRPVLIGAPIATALLIVPTVLLSGPLMWISAALLGMALFLTISTTVLIGQDIFPENRSMGSGIALGLANAVGSIMVLVIGLWVSNVTSVHAVLWASAALSLLTGGLALVFPARLVGRHH